MVQKLIAGNWKMNGLPSDIGQIHAIKAGLEDTPLSCELLLCPPSPLIMQYAAHAGDAFAIGAQDCHMNTSGAHTGDVSAALLKASGASYVIVGHSERRTDHSESDEVVAGKAIAGLDAGLTPIICVGETLEERRSGEAVSVVCAQISKSSASVLGQSYVIAYEPVWAIGTGLTPSIDEIAQMHSGIRAHLISVDAQKGAETRILYGGSMKPGNAAEILAVDHVNGGLIGGASLKSDDFLAIARAA